MTRFNISVHPVWAPFMLIIGVVPGVAHVQLDEDALTVKYGFYTKRIKLSEIESVEPIAWPWYYGYGVRLARGLTLGYVAHGKGVVSLTLREEKKVGLFGIMFKKLAISLTDADAFVTELRSRLNG